MIRFLLPLALLIISSFWKTKACASGEPSEETKDGISGVMILMWLSLAWAIYEAL